MVTTDMNTCRREQLQHSCIGTIVVADMYSYVAAFTYVKACVLAVYRFLTNPQIEQRCTVLELLYCTPEQSCACTAVLYSCNRTL